jgi:hypothetical protein
VFLQLPGQFYAPHPSSPSDLMENKSIPNDSNSSHSYLSPADGTGSQLNTNTSATNDITANHVSQGDAHSDAKPEVVDAGSGMADSADEPSFTEKQSQQPEKLSNDNNVGVSHGNDKNDSESHENDNDEIDLSPPDEKTRHLFDLMMNSEVLYKEFDFDKFDKYLKEKHYHRKLSKSGFNQIFSNDNEDNEQEHLITSFGQFKDFVWLHSINFLQNSLSSWFQYFHSFVVGNPDPIAAYVSDSREVDDTDRVYHHDRRHLQAQQSITAEDDPNRSMEKISHLVPRSRHLLSKSSFEFMRKLTADIDYHSRIHLLDMKYNLLKNQSASASDMNDDNLGILNLINGFIDSKSKKKLPDLFANIPNNKFNLSLLSSLFSPLSLVDTDTNQDDNSIINTNLLVQLGVGNMLPEAFKGSVCNEYVLAIFTISYHHCFIDVLTRPLMRSL